MSDDGKLDRPVPSDGGVAHENMSSPARRGDMGSRERNGERDFATFYRTFAPSLINFLIWHGASFELAADVAQETMRLAYGDWINIGFPRAWARRVAARELARRVSETDYEILTDRVPERPALLVDGADLSGESKRIMALIGQLPPRQRQVMAWTYDGYLPHEIAEEIGISPDAVRSNLRKARRSLIELVNRGGRNDDRLAR